jgi:hypothetical protein
MSQAATPHGGRTVNAARVCSIIGFVLAGIAVFFFPIIFGLAAVVLGVVGLAMGDKVLGTWAIVAGVLGGALGVLLTYLVMS